MSKKFITRSHRRSSRVCRVMIGHLSLQILLSYHRRHPLPQNIRNIKNGIRCLHRRRFRKASVWLKKRYTCFSSTDLSSLIPHHLKK